MNALLKNAVVLTALTLVCGLAAAQSLPNNSMFTPEQVRAQLEKTMKSQNKRLLLPGQSATTDDRVIVCVSGNLGQIRVYKNPVHGVKVTCHAGGKIVPAV